MTNLLSQSQRSIRANVNILLESGMEDKREEGTTERRK